MPAEPLVTIDPQVALIVAALGGLFTAIGGLVLACSVLIPTLRASKVALVKVAEVHRLVNSQHDALIRYQNSLVGTLMDNDVLVPPDPSLRPVEAHPAGAETVGGPPTGPPQHEQGRTG